MPSNARRKLLAMAAATASLLAGAGTATAGTATADHSTAGAARCDLATLPVRLSGGEAGVSHRQLSLVVTNDGDSACTIGGYPDMGAADENQSRLPGVTTKHGPTYFSPDPGARPITLEPGEKAMSQIEWTVPTGGEIPRVQPRTAIVSVPAAGGPVAVPWDGGPVADGRFTATALSE